MHTTPTYNPSLGRFLSADPLFDESINASTPSRFAIHPSRGEFVSPLSYRDPSGMAPEKEKGGKNQIQGGLLEYILDSIFGSEVEEQNAMDGVKKNVTDDGEVVYKEEDELSDDGGGNSGGSDRTGSNESNNGLGNGVTAKDAVGKDGGGINSSSASSGRTYQGVRWFQGQTITCTANRTSSSGASSSGFISSFASDITYSLPVWGNCQRASDCLAKGDYAGWALNFGLAFADGFSLGYSSLTLVSSKTAAKNLFFNKITGVESYLFGKKRIVSGFGIDGVGVLNDSYKRIGWGWNDEIQQYVFRYAKGYGKGHFHYDILYIDPLTMFWRP
ncbi:MAG: hypothetical protein A2X64_05010 [Ignavibacteria bacterium GWF2_33_9]|nr:MAG: hypothetical protein A2X64_05010 [Ignavibacteria bacterium GWF2_33_9]